MIRRHSSLYLRFALVGSSGVLVNLATLTTLLRLGIALYPADLVAIGIASLSNYSLNVLLKVIKP
jgi:putative flippase GtrA